MRQRTHALHGARSLGRTLRAGWGDAFASTLLVTETATSTPKPGRSRLAAAGLDPVSAARAWIETARVAAGWSEERAALVDALLAAAADHFAQLDLKADAVARNAAAAALDDVASQMLDIERMTAELRDFALRLRATLDPASSGTEETDARLRAAVAAQRATGFTGVVAALA